MEMRPACDYVIISFPAEPSIELKILLILPYRVQPAEVFTNLEFKSRATELLLELILSMPSPINTLYMKQRKLQIIE